MDRQFIEQEVKVPKKAATVVTEVDEIETLDDEVVEASKPVKAKKAKKEVPAKPELVGKSSKEAAEELGITPVRLRRILRTDDFTNDGEYTRYDLSDEIIERVRVILAHDAEGRKTRAAERTSKKKAKTENAAEEVSGELEELEDLELEESKPEAEADDDLFDEDEEEEEEDD